MKLMSYDSFNEEFLNISLSNIKKAAFDWHTTKECREDLSRLDSSLLDSVLKEYKILKSKWKSIDILSKKIFAKAEEKNEGVTGTVILTLFGIHAFIKLLKALKHGYHFMKYLGRLFHSGDADGWYTVRDLVISVIFCFYLIGYIVGSTVYSSDCFTTKTGAIVNIPYKWNGIHNYKLIDTSNKHYDLIRISHNNYDVIYNGEKIGVFSNEFWNLNGECILSKNLPKKGKDEEYKTINFDLERALKGKVNSKIAKEVDLKSKELLKISHELDSLNTNLYESVELARKLFKDEEKDYDEFVKTSIHTNPLMHIRDVLNKNNNNGYLGFFARLYLKDRRSSVDSFNWIYDRIKRDRGILDKLRDGNGKLITLFDLDNIEYVQDAFMRLEEWQKVNTFMRRIPSSVKSIIWRNGWYTEELQDKTQFITNCLIKISEDVTLSRTFLSKVSSIKNTDSFISNISRLTNQEPWSFDYWLKKLNSTRNVYVTWSSKDENQIICMVLSHSAIEKIAYMTNWCIVRGSSTFYQYENKGFQCILYDFNYDKSNNNSVIGFTVQFQDFKISNCHDKSDRGATIPSKFLDMSNRRNTRWDQFVDSKYLQIDMSKAVSRFDRGLFRFLTNKTRRFLNKPSISKYIDFYDPDDSKYY